MANREFRSIYDALQRLDGRLCSLIGPPDYSTMKPTVKTQKAKSSLRMYTRMSPEPAALYATKSYRPTPMSVMLVE